MAIIDTLYDIISGIGGTLFGVAVTTLINRKRNRRLSAAISDTQSKVDSLGAENSRLLGIIGDRETRIMELENQILKLTGRRIRKN